MKTKSASPIERFVALSDREKLEEVREFDREFVADTFKPLTPAQRALWERTKRKQGRPRVGKGAQRILVSLEKDLLRRTDSYAKRHGLSRSGLIAQGLKLALAHDTRGPRRGTAA